MHVLACKVKELTGKSGCYIKDLMFKSIKNNTELKESMSLNLEDEYNGEFLSWINSIPKLVSVIEDADLLNLYLILEYVTPVGKNRIDAILVGFDHNNCLLGLLIELKQWFKIDETFIEEECRVRINPQDDLRWHPVAQTITYDQILKIHHSNVDSQQIKLKMCQYLHNFIDKKTLFANKYSIYKPFEGTTFCKDEESKFVEYLNKLFQKREISSEYKLITEGTYVLGDVGFKSLDKAMNGVRFAALLDEQRKISAKLKKQFICYERKVNEKKDKLVIVISGDAGTGKSILGMDLIRTYINLTKSKSCFFTVPSKTIKEVIYGYTEIGSNTYDILKRYNGDLIVVDEAHRLEDLENNMKLLISKFKIIILLQDDHQRIKFSEQGMIGNIKSSIEKLSNNYQIDSIYEKLETQKRAAYNSNYVSLVNRFLEGKNNSIALKKDQYDVKIFHKLKDIDFKLKGIYKEKRSKWLAPYCWIWTKNTENYDIKICEENFMKPWNPLSGQFYWYDVASEKNLNQVGCVYTAQGLDFNYTGVIFWDDLQWREGEWKVDLYKIKDSGFIKDIVTHYGGKLKNYTLSDENEKWMVFYNGRSYNLKEFLIVVNADLVEIKQLVKNIYRILLTRATSGVYIWFKDEKTKEYFKEYFNVKVY